MVSLPVEKHVPYLDGVVAAFAVVAGFFLFLLVGRVHLVGAVIRLVGRGIAVPLVGVRLAAAGLVRMLVGRSRLLRVLALLVRLLRQFAALLLGLYRQYPPVRVLVHRRPANTHNAERVRRSGHHNRQDGGARRVVGVRSVRVLTCVVSQSVASAERCRGRWFALGGDKRPARVGNAFAPVGGFGAGAVRRWFFPSRGPPGGRREKRAQKNESTVPERSGDNNRNAS